MAERYPTKPGEPELFVVDGWITDDLNEYAQFTAPSRSGGLGYWLRLDSRTFRAWALWLTGFAGIAAWFITRRVEALAVGAGALGFYLGPLLLLLGGGRRAKLVEGVAAQFDHPHPHSAACLVGALQDQSLGPIPVFLVRWAVERFRDSDGKMTVLVAYDSQAKWNPIIGIRPPASYSETPFAV